MIISAAFFFLLLALTVSSGALVKSNITNLTQFSYTNCGPSDPISIDSFVLKPDPIVSPGTITISISATGTVDITSPTQLVIQMQKSVQGTYVVIPCIGNFGSCTYDDVCQILQTVFPTPESCPPQFVQQHLPCNCPLPAGHYAVDGAQYQSTQTIPEILEGDYHVTAILNKGSQQLLCADVYFTLQSPQ